MDKIRTPRHAARRSVAAITALALALGPIAPAAYAAPTVLADVPIAAKVNAKPNIVYTVDDSGSMKEEYLPAYVIGGGNYCRNGAGTNVGACTLPALTTIASSYTHPPVYAAEFNALAYNPDVTYTAPVRFDGTSYPDQDNAFTAGWTQVQIDPFLTPAVRRNLITKVNVPLYCNSDWPLDTTADANGQYNPAKGADCRINGTPFDAKANGAPAVVADYNYPWQKSAAASPDDPKYFYRNGAARSLWCDTNSPGWPTVTGACTTGCTVGTVTTTTLPQTWTPTGNTNGCSGNYNPAGCNTSTAYCSPGLGSPPECISGCSCINVVTGRTGTCSYVDPVTGNTVVTNTNRTCAGVGCTATCPNVNNVITGCTMGGSLTTTCATAKCSANSAACSCNSLLKGQPAGGTTLLQDANKVNGGNGTTCRHNNMAYGATPAGLFTYDTAANGGLAPWNTSVTSGCGSAPATVAIPRHYYRIASVQFCSGTNGTANAQWRGFGAGACQNKNDLTTFRNVTYGAFTRADLINDGRTFPYTDPVTGATLTRTYTQEMTNYANWYAYYRTRILAAKTTSSIAFSYLDNTYRVGFHNLGTNADFFVPPGSTPQPIWVDVLDFDLAQKNAWYTALFGITITNYKTQTLDAMLRVGNLFETGGSAGLPAAVNPLPATAKDPIQLSCQSNYHILFTDGFTNQTQLPNHVGQRDQVVQALLVPQQDDVPPDNVLPNLRPKIGLAWPRPFLEGTAVANSLADIATYYWLTDLRPAMKNDVPAVPGKDSVDQFGNTIKNDLDWKKDVAWWQHVNFSAISFGTEGVLDATNQTTVVKQIRADPTAVPPDPGPVLVWPNPNPPNKPTLPAANPGATAVDDLWHATVNSRGSFVNARSPVEVSYGIASILAGIANQRKSRVGAAISGSVISATNNIIYEATIEPGWSGDLLKVQIDPVTGAEIATLWQGSATLKAQLAPAFAGDEPWFTNRRVVTINSATGVAVPFLQGNLSAAQLNTLSANATQQQKMIAYLRGGSTFGPGPTPQVIEGTSIGQFRSRYGALGDLTNAQPVIVDKPGRPYLDGTDPGYSGYLAAQSARAKRIFAPANDGMVHVFDDATGNEVYAFIPKALFRNGPTGLHALTYQDGGVPIFKHKFYVDSSPRSGDVDFSGGLGTDWRTIVVGGLGKGGGSYYALDATNAAAANENAAAAKVLWEWTDPDVVYTYGRPVIVKTRAHGWVVIVTAGYNNVSGLGKIFFIDPVTGTTVKTMSTGSGTPGNPSGLAQIHGYVKDYRNQIVEQIYGGDLNGDFWRFDVSNPNPALWTVTLMAQLRDAGGVGQPITTAPQIEIDYNNGIDRFVFIGTGQLLDESDLRIPNPPQQQTLYAMKDGTAANPNTVGLPVTRAILQPINPNGVSAIVGGAPNGWYHDLPAGATGERVVVDVVADVNVVSYVGTQAQPDPCVISLPASLYAREYSTGASLLKSGGAIVPSVFFAGGAVGANLIGRTQPDGSYSLGVLISEEGTPGTKPVDIVNPVKGVLNRLSWRLLQGE